MYFQHTDEIWSDYPTLVPGVVFAGGISPDVDVADQVAKFQAVAESRLANGTESDLPEIQAWRRAYSKMGLKPTQYRCASEALLRRLRKEGDLPRIHPLVDLCNAISAAFAIPVAAIDLANVHGYLEVRYATGDETYVSFSGQIEHPEPREVIFADAAGQAHARRWTNRQSGHSAVQPTTREVLIVAEALHDSAATDVAEVTAAIADALTGTWHTSPKSALVSRTPPRFTV